MLRALIEEAKRRARRRRTVVLLAFAAVASVLMFVTRDNSLAASATAADATKVPTSWQERVGYANGKGFLRIYVRRLEVTGSRWTARVGMTNNSSMTVRLVTRQDKPNPDTPFTYWAGPGIWWSSYVKGGTWWPGAGTVLTHSVRATVTPRYPTSLAPRKSWFGTFSGPTAKLPRDRLLRIGFGILDLGRAGYNGIDGRPLRREVVVSTVKQFRLPPRR